MSASQSIPYNNPTLYSNALTEAEHAPGFKWHTHARSPRSSQVFCLSAFGTLRSIPDKDHVLETLFRRALPEFPKRKRPRKWQILPEAEMPELMSEYGNQATSIDALCVSSDEVICIESKFATDAKEGFGCCSQFPKSCAGFRGPGSDIAKGTADWCRLESWDGNRAPRAYWSLGKRWFRPEIFEFQRSSDTCVFRGSNYQLMRNFLFAGALAERDKKSHFGVLALGPRRFSTILSNQVEAFRRNVLQEEFADLITFVEYETYIDILIEVKSGMATELGEFLTGRIIDVLGSD